METMMTVMIVICAGVFAGAILAAWYDLKEQDKAIKAWKEREE